MSTSNHIVQPQKSVEILLKELEAALYLRPWIDEPEERHELTQDIIRMVRADESSLALLLKYLKHPDWAMRRNVAEMLGWLRNPDSVKPLMDMLWRDRIMAVRGSVALAMERVDTPESTAASQEYAAAIRSYPEVVGQVINLAERKGLSSHNLFAAALRSQTCAIRIQDPAQAGQDKVLSFDLCDLLALIGRPARDSLWCCRSVECTGKSASELDAIADQGLIVSGRTFTHIALLLDQTIEGEFVALREDEAWLVIRAVDSSWFEVWSRETALLEEIRSHFRCVEKLDMGRT
jgi:hypothetical protein